MSPEDTIRTYFDCFKNRDRETLEKILTPNFIHSSPFGYFDNRDKMLDTIWPSVGDRWAIDLEIFSAGDGYMARYRHNVDPQPLLAEFIRFEGDRMAEIEVYLGKGAVPGMG